MKMVRDEEHCSNQAIQTEIKCILQADMQEVETYTLDTNLYLHGIR